MEIHKKILLILTILIASIIIFRLWNRRLHNEKLYGQIENPYGQIKSPYGQIEPFKSSINMTNTQDTSLPINQYFIKASWNTAYDNNANIMDLSMVTKVLNRGCRFLDFEVYSTTLPKSSTVIPIVGYSIQPKNNYQMDCNDPTLNLIDVLNYVKDYAFLQGTSSGPPNVKDPLFIQLRVKSANPLLYQSLPTVIKSALGSSLVLPSSSSGFNKTLLSTMVGGNTIYLFADLVNSDPMFASKYDSYKLFSNITVADTMTPGILSLSNSSILQSCKRPPKIIDSNTMSVGYQMTTYSDVSGSNNVHFVESFPDFSIQNITANSTAYPPSHNKIHAKLNSDITNMIMNYGINIIPFRFYIDDNGLADYENIFTYNGNCAFVKMGLIIKNFNDMTTTTTTTTTKK
jgi:hypothetical protein